MGCYIWKAPEQDITKVNIDGSFRSKTGKAGIGVIFRNHFGEVRNLYADEVKASSAFMAEALAARKALDMIKLSGSGKFLIETDCEALFKAVKCNSSDGCEWQSQIVVEDIVMSLRSASDVSFGLVYRSSNKAADWLAASSSKGVCFEGCPDQPPPSLAKLLSDDRSRCVADVGAGFCQARTGVG
ncbi:uncharacterized protein LOC114745550 [Neltuma alba]|uniref:uncharacterized protein LOC114745550 n=1 Tax=Neltuma alba TaxID=207710 RepID=UPI0010A48BD1|nr:uncharacterized protein LOC114745550 [Prosopis alba]